MWQIVRASQSSMGHTVLQIHIGKKRKEICSAFFLFGMCVYISAGKRNSQISEKKKKQICFSLQTSLCHRATTTTTPSFSASFAFSLPHLLPQTTPSTAIISWIRELSLSFFLSPFQIDPSLDWLQVFDAEIIIDPDLSPPLLSLGDRALNLKRTSEHTYNYGIFSVFSQAVRRKNDGSKKKKETRFSVGHCYQRKVQSLKPLQKEQKKQFLHKIEMAGQYVYRNQHLRSGLRGFSQALSQVVLTILALEL